MEYFQKVSKLLKEAESTIAAGITFGHHEAPIIADEAHVALSTLGKSLQKFAASPAVAQVVKDAETDVQVGAEAVIASEVANEAKRAESWKW